MRDAVGPEASGVAADSSTAQNGAAQSGAAQSGAAQSGAAEAAPAASSPDGDGLVAVEAEAAAMFGHELPRARKYADLLTGAGVERGIVGPAEAERIWDRHLLNCGAVARLIPATSSVVDLGSGAGLPGIVLALLLPGATITLLEPMARRVDFLTECVAALKLTNTTVLRGRAEDMAGHISADVVTARAVAPLDRLAGLMLGLLRSGGRALAIKGASAESELARSRPVLARLGIVDAKVVHAGIAGALQPASSSAETAGGTAPAAGAGSAGAGSAGAGSAGAGSASVVLSATTVVTFTAPEHRGTGPQSGRAPAYGQARAAGIPGGPRSARGGTGGRRSRPNSRRGGG
jgi:16S rRNA (guanine527-N7)-methyltransferase